MSIREYPKHQFVLEYTNDDETFVFKYTPSFDGYLSNTVLKIVTNNSINLVGRSKLIVKSSSNEVTLGESSWLDYSNILKTSGLYHSKIRFDFDEIPVKSGMDYKFYIYQESTVNTETDYLAYCIDYNYPVNQSNLPIHPFANSRLAAEIYLKRDYYDFN